MFKLGSRDIASRSLEHPSSRLPSNISPDHPALELEFTQGSSMVQLRLELRVGGNPSMPLGLVSREAAKDGDPVGGHAISGSLERQRLC